MSNTNSSIKILWNIARHIYRVSQKVSRIIVAITLSTANKLS